MSQDEKESFNYFLANKGSVLVVTFVGAMNFSSFENLQRCREEIDLLNDIKLVVLHFRAVPSVCDESITALTKMQISIRSRSSALSICALKPSVREKLLTMGVIRPREISDNLQGALKSFMTGANSK